MFYDRYEGVTLDDAAAVAGGCIAYTTEKKFVMDYDLCELSKYCRERNIEPIDLPEEELKQFEINPPLIYPKPSS